MLLNHCWKIVFSFVSAFFLYHLSYTFYWLYLLMRQCRISYSAYQNKNQADTVFISFQIIAVRYFSVLWVKFLNFCHRLHLIGYIRRWQALMINSPQFYKDKNTIKLTLFLLVFNSLLKDIFRLHFIGCISWWHNLESVILYSFTRIKIRHDWHCFYFLSNHRWNIFFSSAQKFLYLLIIFTHDTFSDGLFSFHIFT